ncbi:pantoate--beta-alanine ligase [Motiliproteus sediminis]|uniref:pantoate--beta-alanine ligase n=1 Tax=Motiliproteus sediminis TaxID=1468178 RepID=UPI001AEF4D48|nr:pantoate--beta-alanine ligase [Motiliproteus sediminis]
MQILHTIAELRTLISGKRREGARIGFVPTMGNLHSGHIALVHEAKRHADFIVASIFVNPLQFGANEDLDSYPRTLAEDSTKLADAGCHCLFAPTVAEMYPQGGNSLTRVSVPALSDQHCGASRPGHFEGVATVVTKLFGIVQPDVAVFGRKDYQQLAVIRQLTDDLCLPVDIIGVATERAESGLALSSRNGYLSDHERQQAATLYATLNQLADRIRAGERNYPELEESGNQALEQQGFQRDYLHICHAHTLQRATSIDNQLVILAAAKLGKARLIDNLELTLNPA